MCCAVAKSLIHHSQKCVVANSLIHHSQKCVVAKSLIYIIRRSVLRPNRLYTSFAEVCCGQIAHIHHSLKCDVAKSLIHHSQKCVVVNIAVRGRSLLPASRDSVELDVLSNITIFGIMSSVGIERSSR